MDQQTAALDTRLDETDAHDDELVEELLIEEISIDGMCGVY
jgi:mycofactocin precursor